MHEQQGVESLLCLSVHQFVRGHRDERLGRISNICSRFLLQRSYKWKNCNLL